MGQSNTLTAYGTDEDKQMLTDLSEALDLSHSKVIVKLIRDKHQALFPVNQKEPST